MGAGRQVIDKTGLSGDCDFTLYYDFCQPPADDSTEPILEDAVEQQLGLKPVSSKAPFDFVIVERGEKTPLEN